MSVAVSTLDMASYRILRIFVEDVGHLQHVVVPGSCASECSDAVLGDVYRILQKAVGVELDAQGLCTRPKVKRQGRSDSDYRSDILGTWGVVPFARYSGHAAVRGEIPKIVSNVRCKSCGIESNHARFETSGGLCYPCWEARK